MFDVRKTNVRVRYRVRCSKLNVFALLVRICSCSLFEQCCVRVAVRCLRYVRVRCMRDLGMHRPCQRPLQSECWAPRGIEHLLGTGPSLQRPWGVERVFALCSRSRSQSWDVRVRVHVGQDRVRVESLFVLNACSCSVTAVRGQPCFIYIHAREYRDVQVLSAHACIFNIST